MSRRRYDTNELVTELKRERRNALVLSLAGIGILLILLLIFFAVGDDDVPAVPIEDVVTSTVPEVGKDPLMGNRPAAAEPSGEAAGEPAAVEEPAPVSVTPATVKLVLTKKGVVWVDGEKLGKLKKKKLELMPGPHEIKAKFGKKIITETIEPEPGKAYELRIDKKRKKTKLKTL